LAATVLGLLALTLLIYATRDYGNGAAQIDAAEPTCAEGQADAAYAVPQSPTRTRPAWREPRSS